MQASTLQRTLASIFSTLILQSCVGGGDSSSSGNIEPPNPSVLLFAVATGTSTISLTWQDKGPNVLYNVYVASISDFTPDLTTLKGTFSNVSDAQIGGLSPDTTYYVKIVSYRESEAASSQSTNELSVHTPRSAPHLQAGVVVKKDVDLGLTPTSIDGATITYTMGSDATTPSVGSYIYGVFGQSRDPYFRSVVSTTVVGSTLTLKTADAKLSDILDGGTIDYAIATTSDEIASAQPALSAERTRRAATDDGGSGCTFTLGVAADVAVPQAVVKATFVPTYHANIDVASATLTANVSGAYNFSASASIAASDSVTYECTGTLFQPLQLNSYTFLIPVGLFIIPITVSTTLNAEYNENANLTGKFSYAASITGKGTANAAITATTSDGQTAITATADVESDSDPIFSFQPSSPLTSELNGSIKISAKVYVKPQLFIGAGRFRISTGAYAELGVNVGPKIDMAITQSPAMVSSIQSAQLSKLSSVLEGTAFASLGLDNDITKLLGLSGQKDVESDPVDLKIFDRPVLSLTASGALMTTTATLLYPPAQDLVPIVDNLESIKWYTDSAAVDTSGFSGKNPILLDGTNVECLTASITDSVTGELGRYFAPPIALNGDAAACQPNTQFTAISVPAISTIFDPDNVLTVDQLAALGPPPYTPASPSVLALRFAAGAGQTMTFSATGLVGCCGTANVGPDGDPNSSMNISGLGPISGFNAHAGLPLLGVFTNGNPTGTAPAPYNYSAGLAQTSFSPLLNQVFFIGDGLTGNGSGATQVFNVPATATELWLGYADGSYFVGPPTDYADNVGEAIVSGTLNGGGTASLSTKSRTQRHGSAEITDRVKFDDSHSAAVH